MTLLMDGVFFSFFFYFVWYWFWESGWEGKVVYECEVFLQAAVNLVGDL